MARIHDIVFDCRHPASLARFWAAALDGYKVADYDPEELARLAAMDVHDTEDDPTVLVLPLGPGPRLCFQRVPEPRSTKNRLHLDIVGGSGEIDRLQALGASVLAELPNWVTLADPEGNEFCVMPA